MHSDPVISRRTETHAGHFFFARMALLFRFRIFSKSFIEYDNGSRTVYSIDALGSRANLAHLTAMTCEWYLGTVRSCK